MTRKQFAEWIAALRSGEYKQGRGKLRTDDKCYCCLGVYADIVDPENKTDWKGDFYLSKSLVESFYSDHGSHKDKDERPSLVHLNDDERQTFSEIADILEANPEDYVIFSD